MAKAWEAPPGAMVGHGTVETPWRQTATRWLARLGAWEQRAAQRRQLAELDDRALADIGRTRAEALAEAAKPFWQA